MENKKITWRTELAREKGSALYGDFRANYDKVTERMKKKYPGNYIVEEYFDSNSLTFDLRLKFDTSEDEIIFLLKNTALA